MNPERYIALKQNIQSLDNAATRMSLPEGTSPTTMKNRLLRVAADLNIPVTVRKVPGGVLFWRFTQHTDCTHHGRHRCALVTRIMHAETMAS
jgi:hypothetical protein